MTKAEPRAEAIFTLWCRRRSMLVLDTNLAKFVKAISFFRQMWPLRSQVSDSLRSGSR